jgi:mono/diheme cytochrome c family protein
MRRLAPVFAGCVLLAGCGGGSIVAPTAKEVVGTLPKATAVPKGNLAKGKTLFAGKGCTGCHTYKPAGSTAKVGPDLDKITADAQKANVGSVDQYAFESIKNPSGYVVPGYKDVMPNYGTQLSDKQIADLVAFVTKKS